MRFLVTGAAGFIGYHLSTSLLKRGFEVYGVDDLSRGSAKRVEELRKIGMNFFKIDVCDLSKVRDLVSRTRPDVVVHLAALISVPESFEKPELYRRVNAYGTWVVASAANEARVERFVYMSSAAVYGDPLYLPIDEKHPTKPVSPYGLSKLEGERWALKAFQAGCSIILRLFNVYGPGQSTEYAGVITRFIERLSRGEPPIIFGDGNQTRDFIHIADVVDAVIKASTTSLAESEILNVGSGKAVKIIDLARLLIRLFGLDLEPIHADPRPGDIRHSYADISRIKRVLGWQPKISLEEGLKRLVENLRSG